MDFQDGSGHILGIKQMFLVILRIMFLIIHFLADVLKNFAWIYLKKRKEMSCFSQIDFVIMNKQQLQILLSSINDLVSTLGNMCKKIRVWIFPSILER